MIRLEALEKRFGAQRAVNGLDLAVREGELFCILGPNGAGKTTTLKMITGLLRPTSGRVLVGGNDIQQSPVAAKRLLGYIPDRPFLYPKLSARELMRFVAGLYRIENGAFEGRCRELLEVFELSHVADALIETMSHGMRQKLSFASTFLHDPAAVVVDEPWVGLDPKNIRSVKRYLREQADGGTTILMSTHTLAIAEELADRIAILHRGRLLALGTVAEIKALAAKPGSLEDVFLELTREES